MLRSELFSLAGASCIVSTVVLNEHHNHDMVCVYQDVFLLGKVVWNHKYWGLGVCGGGGGHGTGLARWLAKLPDDLRSIPESTGSSELYMLAITCVNTDAHTNCHLFCACIPNK